MRPRVVTVFAITGFCLSSKLAAAAAQGSLWSGLSSGRKRAPFTTHLKTIPGEVRGSPGSWTVCGVAEGEHGHAPAITVGMVPAPRCPARGERVNRHRTLPWQPPAAAVLCC